MDSPAQERTLRLPISWGKEDRAREQQPHVQQGPSDEEVLVRVCAGDKDSLALLFDRYSQLLFRVVYRILGDFGEAEELVQEVFLHLFSRAINFDPAKGAARPWMVQVACHRALDRRTYLLRRRFWSGTNLDLVAESLSGGRNLEEELAASSDRAELERVLQDLPEKQRVALQLYFFEAMELKEISEKMGESLPNVRHHYYRGLERLRKTAFAQQLREKFL